MNIRQWRQRLTPTSLLSRMLILLLLGIALAQGISNLFWSYRFEQTENEGLIATSKNLAMNLSSTVRFFESLPLRYRHIVLNQLRNMGGTRFFVSLNREKINIESIPPSSRKQLVVNEVNDILHQQLGHLDKIVTNFSAASTLKVLNNHTLMTDLPRSWAHYTLTMEPLNPPILVTQIELKPHEWIYLAALLPAPYMMLDEPSIPPRQLLNLVLTTSFLCIFTFVLVRRQTRPLNRLASAASQLALNLYQPPLKEEGSIELVRATRAFNTMQEKLKRYIDDREQLFRSISHDLKTPITRLRLRTELLEDEKLIATFNRDLDELEIMAKGALQTVKDTDIHENLQDIDIHALLKIICESYADNIEFQGAPMRRYRGKPLAIKRCIGNIVDNAIKYGQHLTVVIEDSEPLLRLNFIDQGPGIPTNLHKDIFSPYVRLDKTTSGNGLGLGIARNIAHAHGGEITLENLPTRGLKVILELPHIR
ncbi:ATP-binding protein [Celerinatantimonas diazotrophica]|uniref:histidine kinase n=1 Tax=Celerinatantimonas diazotrophica TaxID=412034 RepID=A0A4R1J9M8_9GAMM|nr:ATP-binding protein [Celerinatantimonas diazotrophica]TCK47312.1 signal transduction histidine kinase [Celerinatantimonas diazotrophica]CAG9295072.1 Adaptive-response sensory-kinase SasA [Celerinatantimonas diazotrophica]